MRTREFPFLSVTERRSNYKKFRNRIMSTIHYKSDQKTVQEILNFYEKGQLNLEPGFQRSSVWSDRDRAKLVDSILRNYPLPSIFLYKRHPEGDICYDVIDGKQRIERS